MKGNEIYTKDWCDLLFENRNKKYGAYVLRAQTGHRYKWALAFIFCIFLLFAAPFLIILLMTSLNHYKPVDPVAKMVRFEGIRIKEARPMRRPPRKSAPEVVRQEDMKNIKLIDDKDMVATIAHPEDEKYLDEKKIVDMPEDSLETLIKEKDLHLARHGEQTDGVILTEVPQFPDGGIRQFMRWLSKTMVYPPACVRAKVEGTVEAAFIVEPDGTIRDIRVLKSANPMLDHETVRVLSLMPKWIPGHKYGRPIRSQVTLPVVFSLSDFSMD